MSLAALQTQLADLQTVITARLTGTAVESYSEATESLRNTPLLDLFKIQKELRAQIAAEGGDGGTPFSYGVQRRDDL
jgi:hypothetical protein